MPTIHTIPALSHEPRPTSPSTHAGPPSLVHHVVAEARKLTSVRLLHGHYAAAAGLGIVGVLASSGQPALDAAAPAHQQQFMIVAALARIPLVLLGLRIAVDEYRHGTAAITHATARDRRMVALAKGLVASAAGAAVGLAAQATTFAVATLAFASRGHSLGFDGRLHWLLLGAAFAGSAWAAIGAAIGELSREPIAPTIAVALWFVALEELLASRLGDLGSLLPGSQGYVLVLTGQPGPASRAAVGMLAWSVLATGLASTSIARRDLA